jgi:hypothetical protein
LIAVGAGFIGAALNCEGGEGCRGGFPSWLEPWTRGEYYVYPEASIVAVIALIPASAFVALVVAHRRWLALAALAVSTLLLSFAFFGGLTHEGRTVFWFGPLLGLAAVGIISASHGRERFANRLVKPS